MTNEEFNKFKESDLIDVRPVIIPRGENLIEKNDYYMWPISTMIKDTMVVLYSRGTCHWGAQKSESDKNGGIRMIVTSSNGGKTWSLRNKDGCSLLAGLRSDLEN
ncbi:MAG: hypothetical protein PF904_05040 [Kiritimatiellae bacterium]|nr:hypothetical protein [Kiritimatiellia bacterium]